MIRSLAGLLAAVALALPAHARAGSPAAVSAFDHGTRTGNAVALTFDACTTPARTPYDPRIPALLHALDVPATFFVGGGWAREEAPALAALARDPLFEIGNHAFAHPHLTRLSEAETRAELARAQAAIAAVTGRAPALFRPPYGEYDARVLRAAADEGLTTVEYDLPSGDPDPRATTEGLVAWVLRRAQPGSIIVMHVNHPAFHTAEALPAIVAGLRARGLRLVTVGELLREARRHDLVAAATPAPQASSSTRSIVTTSTRPNTW